MPISIVVGGQYGSEGKGKVALDLLRRDSSTTIVVRPGGTNSGHTGYSLDGRRRVLRQLPVAAIDGHATVVFPAGSYIDVDLLLREIAETGLPASKIVIDPRAQLIRPEHIAWEAGAGLVESIGSTKSGTGAAVISRIARFAPQHVLGIQATDSPALASHISDAAPIMSAALRRGERIIIEGTQGFGLSVLHTDSWPKCTSRDTTAAGFLSEAGLSPLDVDRVILVIRSYPIRVAGDSGPLPEETTWDAIAADAGLPLDLREFTSVTHKLRRVGKFSSEVVRRAIEANSPTDIVLNHLDYIDATVRGGGTLTEKAKQFLESVEEKIGQSVNWLGTDEMGTRPVIAPVGA
jgi:adenylosuccinate synthase